MSIPFSQHQQYPIISALSQKLKSVLTDAVLHEAYTLSKEELILVFYTKQSHWFTFKIIMRYQSCFLLFDNHKPEKASNAQPCFESICTKKINAIVQHIGNRSFVFQFDHHFQLVFKLYDSLVNVLLFNDQQVEAVFRKNIVKDWELTLDSFSSNTLENKEVYTDYFIYQRTHQHPFYVSTSIQLDTLILQSTDVFTILTEFSRLCLSYYHFTTTKQQLLSNFTAEAKKLEGTRLKNNQAFLHLQTTVSNEEIGHIIMANLQQIKPQMTEAILYDFYRNTQLMVKLKKELNPQQNAAYYFRKHKNSSTELNLLMQKKEQTETRLKQLYTTINKLQLIVNLKDLKPFLPKDGIQKQVDIPFKQFEHEGFQIWVGKSAANNDVLTLKHSHKNDMWLHAKDVSGSHVLIKWKPGKDFSNKVLKRAAELAAYYSKSKGSTLVPVSYTLKKFVRKPKGALPGQVIIDKEEVLLVEPKTQ